MLAGKLTVRQMEQNKYGDLEFVIGRGCIPVVVDQASSDELLPNLWPPRILRPLSSGYINPKLGTTSL